MTTNFSCLFALSFSVQYMEKFLWDSYLEPRNSYHNKMEARAKLQYGRTGIADFLLAVLSSVTNQAMKTTENWPFWLLRLCGTLATNGEV